MSIFIGNLFNWWSVSLEGRLAVFDSIIMSIWIWVGRLAVLDRIILFIWILVSCKNFLQDILRNVFNLYQKMLMDMKTTVKAQVL